MQLNICNYKGRNTFCSPLFRTIKLRRCGMIYNIRVGCNASYDSIQNLCFQLHVINIFHFQSCARWSMCCICSRRVFTVRRISLADGEITHLQDDKISQIQGLRFDFVDVSCGLCLRGNPDTNCWWYSGVYYLQCKHSSYATNYFPHNEWIDLFYNY